MKTNDVMVERIEEDKVKYMEYLLLADPSEEMVMKYLTDGDLFVIKDGKEVACVAVVLLDGGIAEIKNIGTTPAYQRKGYGKAMIDYLIEAYRHADGLILGTGRTGIPEKEFYQLEFYRKCGFVEYRVIKNFFVDNYPEPIFEENGKQCIDMVYLKYQQTS